MDKGKQIESISLYNWIRDSHTDEEKREVFLNMDIAMKYVHERGYCVKSFSPREIEILNNSLDQIKFNTLLEMPNDRSYQKKLIGEDIFNSSLLQIGIYADCLKFIKPEFVKSNFANFATFLPESDIPYYRGVIERDAAVYFTEFELERRKREISSLEKEANELENDNSKQLIKTNTRDLSSMFSNDKINDTIYRQINGYRDAAFVNVLMYPLIFGIIFVLFTLIFVSINIFVI